MFVFIHSLTENWQYIHTECSSGWWPHQGFCYRLLSETEGTWEESSEACNSRGANLTSIRSLSEVEMLINLLANCKNVVGEDLCVVKGVQRYRFGECYAVCRFWG